MSGYHAAEAIEHARAASETAQQITSFGERFDSIQRSIGAEREAAQKVASQGYRLELGETALVASEKALESAATALQAQGPQAALGQLEAAQQQLAQGIASGSGAPALRAENERRLADIKTRGDAAAERITEGRRVFDLVDEFAESTWSDIKGNGSEAQAAADRAHQHWEQARQGNSMQAQTFYATKQHLDTANQELDYVDKLIDAILTRLKDLETARDSARGLLAEAERSLTAGLEFVRANDPDVGKAPEVKLHEAAEQLAIAKAEVGQAKPDWLKLSAAASAADRLADEALAGARSEAEAMAKLRQQIEQFRPIVSGEVNKIAKFVNVRGEDITPPTLATVKSLVQRFEQAQALDQQAGNLEEEARHNALQQALAAYAMLQSESEKVYQLAYNDAQRLEQLRANLNSQLSTARAELEEAEALVAQAWGRAKGDERQRLEQARAAFERIRMPITGEANLTRTATEAREIAQIAREVANAIRSRMQRPPGGGIGPVIITGGWGGSGSWSGGGGGGGGPTWGGGGGGGGSFGGGGGGGGSFGGGGGGGGGGW